MNTDPRRLADRARDLAEFNPMLGFRGCRLAIAYPEIAEMQARAIFEAAVEAAKRTGKPVSSCRLLGACRHHMVVADVGFCRLALRANTWSRRGS